MEISNRHDVALGLLVNLRDSATSLRVIAVELGTSISYLESIAQKFRTAGLIRSTRGPGGGYTLAKPLEEICVGEVLSLLQSKKHKPRVGMVDNLVNRIAELPISQLTTRGVL